MNRVTTGCLVLFSFFIFSISFLTPLAVDAGTEHYHSKLAYVLSAIRSLGILETLLADSIQVDLGLDPDQITLIRELRERNVSALCAFYNEVKKGRDELEEEAKSLDALAAISLRIRRDMMLALRGDQRLHFKEVLLHTVGWSSLLDADVLKPMEHILALTPTQMESLARLRNNFQRQIFQIVPATSEETIKTISRIRQKEEQTQEKYNELVRELLTTEQQKVLRRVAGKRQISNQPLPIKTTENPFQSCDAALRGK